MSGTWCHSITFKARWHHLWELYTTNGKLMTREKLHKKEVFRANSAWNTGNCVQFHNEDFQSAPWKTLMPHLKLVTSKELVYSHHLNLLERRFILYLTEIQSRDRSQRFVWKEMKPEMFLVENEIQRRLDSFRPHLAPWLSFAYQTNVFHCQYECDADGFLWVWEGFKDLAWTRFHNKEALLLYCSTSRCTKK